MRASKGTRRGTRHKFRQQAGTKPAIRRFLQPFQPHDRVVIVADPASHKTMPYTAFQGLAGTVLGRRGNAYVVAVTVGSKQKTVITAPEHLMAAGAKVIKKQRTT
jgi:large subunit ribosomal protein L21e